MSNGLIFISYRREDAAGYARAIYDQFVQHFSRERVFMDVDAIEPGLPFDEALEKAVGRCEVLLAVIDRNWLAPRGAAGARINDPKDYVRLEIAAALSRNIRVLPVLLDGAKMPSEEELPEPLRALSRRQAIEISNSSFKSDVARLISSVSRAILPATTKPPSPKYLTFWVTLGVLGLGALFWIVYVQFGRSVDASVEESEPNDQAAKMNKISFPGKIRGSLENADDRDVFGFTTPSKMKASNIRTIFRPLSSGNFSPELNVYDKNWQLIDKDWTPGYQANKTMKITIASISNSSYFVMLKMLDGHRAAYELEVGAEDAAP